MQKRQCCLAVPWPAEANGFASYSINAGAVFIQIIQTQLDKFGEVKFESLSGANARKIVLVIGIMSAHALGEGCGVGVSFCGTRGWAQVNPPLRPCPALPACKCNIHHCYIVWLLAGA